MTQTILLICSCGSEKDFKRQLLWDNKNGFIACHVCGLKYSASDILANEKNGIADFTEVKS